MQTERDCQISSFALGSQTSRDFSRKESAMSLPARHIARPVMIVPGDDVASIEPGPLQVGDRVVHKNGTGRGIVIAINKGRAWWDDDESNDWGVSPLAYLTRVEDKP